MLRRLKRVFSGSVSSDTLVKCRQCGAKLEEEADSCPECESSEFARYQL